MTTTSLPPTTDTRRAGEHGYELATDITAPDDRSPEQVEADEIAYSLTTLAAFIHANPHLVEHFRYTALGSRDARINIPISSTVADQRAAVAAFARAAARSGRTVTKKAFGTGDTLYGVEINFGTLGISVYGDRDQVCERVVTGTREVTEEIPDPEALAAVPKTTVTRTEDVVEWRCTSLLAPADGDR